MLNSRLRLVGTFAILASLLQAQSTVVSGTAARPASMPRTHIHTLVSAGDGSLWTVVVLDDSTANTSDTALTQSTDGGKTWKGLFFYPTKNQNIQGAIYIGSDCHTLHALWTDRLNDGFNHLHYQSFNTLAKIWIGQPIVVQKGTSTWKWFPHDIQITAKGTIVLGASTGVGGGPGFTGQATVLFVKKVGDSKFSAPMQVNRGTTIVTDIGRAPSLHSEGELIHVLYRTKRSPSAGIQWGFSYRSYNTETATFLQSADVHVGPSNNTGVNSGLLKATALDQSGNLYCVYVSPGKLRMAYGAKGKTGTNAGWTDLNIATDASLLGGNSPSVAYSHFGISTAAGDLVNVIYSKLSDNRSKLYVQTFMRGQPLIKPPNNERLLKGTTFNDSFVRVNGDANVRSLSGSFALSSGTPSSNANGIVEFFNINNNAARAVDFGATCQGKLNAAPGMRALTPPLLGRNFDFVIERLPKTAPIVMLLDLSCLPVSFELTGIGAPKCFLHIPPTTTLVFPPQPTGSIKISAPLPNDRRFIGARVFLQSLIIDSTANVLGIVTTNALAMFF